MGHCYCLNNEQFCVTVTGSFLTGEATGLRKCSYEALRKGTVTLEGLPEGMSFTNPWAAGKKKLAQILEIRDSLFFRCMYRIMHNYNYLLYLLF